MTYLAPFVDASGLHIPTYADIENLFVAKAKALFGDEIYLENDSADFQLIAALAQAIYDTLLAAQLAYNNRSPVSAVGSALDTVVAINGIRRIPETHSVVTLTLTGTPFSVIRNGIVSDVNGVQWNLPDSVTIGSGGTVSSTATAAQAGPITAPIGEITVIQTPTAGWVSVTNPIAATPGRAAETDAELRARQAASVSDPSQALTTGILGSVLSVPGVVSAELYENDTKDPVSSINGVTNPDDFPPNSLTLVVDGGDGAAIADEIHRRKTPGCYMNGDQTFVMYDRYGVPTTIRFFRPVTKTIDVAISITGLAANGYTSEIGIAAVQAIADYINSLVAGQNVIISELWQAALSLNTNPRKPYFSLTALTAGIHPGALADTDITMTFVQQAVTTVSSITLTVS